MLLVPYRSKSAPESFPYATIVLIAINIVVYCLTSESLLFVRKSALELLAVSHSTVGQQPFRVITAMFLHGSLTHILGNMLFLGVFGPGAEGRLRTTKFLML